MTSYGTRCRSARCSRLFFFKQKTAYEIQLFNSPDLIGKGFEDVEFLGHTMTFTRATYYLTWAIALVLLVIAWFVLRGVPGRAFKAVRDSELAATSSGIHIAAYKTFAFALSAAYAGVAGSLLVMAVAFADPNSFPAKLSLTTLVGADVAGPLTLVASPI